MKKILLALGLLLFCSPAYAELIHIDIPAYISTWMDARHYDPTEIDSLALPPNTNGEKTYYIDGTNGSDSYSGLCATKEAAPSNCGPYKTLKKPFGQYEGHKYGERVLVRAGYYNMNYGLMDNVVVFDGTDDDNHWNSIGPYGDGEVVIDLSYTPYLGTFTTLSGNVYKSTYSSSWPGTYTNPVFWGVMDWNPKSCKPAIGYKGTDNRGTNNRTTSFTDTTKNFSSVTWNDGVHSGTVTTNFVGAIVWNITDGSWGAVTSVSTTTNANDTLNFSGGLTGGSDNDFDNGDSYAVYIMDEDGRFATVGDKFYIVSTSGEPRTRNLLVSGGNDASDSLLSFGGDAQKWLVYGLTIVGSNGAGISFVRGTRPTFRAVKNRIMFCGKAAFAPYSNNPTLYYEKNFIYGMVMNNWPRGNKWCGDGSWPNIIDGAGRGKVVKGNIGWAGGGEGSMNSELFTDNILADNFSVGLYTGGTIGTAQNPTVIERNVLLHPNYRQSDIWDLFYLKNCYNGLQRTYAKIMPVGLTLGQEGQSWNYGEASLPGQSDYYYFRNNISIGHLVGLNIYAEDTSLPNRGGWSNDQFMNNTIIMPVGNYLDTTINPGDSIPKNASMLGALLTNYTQVVNGVDTNVMSYVKNNLIIGSDYADGQRYLAQGSGVAGVEYDNNVYSFPSHGNFWTTASKNFTEWKAATNWDTNSILTDTPGVGTGVNWSDLSSITKEDLQLVSTSIAKDAGVNWTAYYAADYDYGTRPTNGINWDIGAFEYGASPAIPTCVVTGDTCVIDGDCCSTYCCGSVCSATTPCTFPTPTPTLTPTPTPTPTPCVGCPTPTPTPTPTITPTPTPTPQICAPGNVACGKTAYADSSYDNPTLPGKAVDGSISTEWTSANSGGGYPLPHWLYVDLGTVENIDTIIVKHSERYPSEYKIQKSNDASTWADIYSTAVGVGGNVTLDSLTDSARYIRFYAINTPIDPNSPPYYGGAIGLLELEVYASVVPTSTPTPTPTNTPTPTPTPATSAINIALNVPVYAVSEESSSLEPSNVNDGDTTTTRWSSGDPGPDTAWICLDLGATCDINHVKLFWETAYASGYTVYTSDTSCTEGLSSIYTTAVGDGGTDDLTSLSGNGQYLIVDGTTKGTEYGYSLWEIEAYSNTACTPITNPTPTPTSTPTPTPDPTVYKKISGPGANAKIKNLGGLPADSQIIKNLQ